MIKYVKGNLFDSSATVLVNTVNTVGVMGKGIALQFKQRYPDMFEDYRARCQRREILIGKPYLYIPAYGDKQIMNFPTKRHWRNPSSPIFINLGMTYLRANWESFGLTSIAIPPLGCGNGGLDWKVIKQIIEFHLAGIPIDVEVYQP